MPLDKASEAIIGRAAHDVALHLRFKSTEAYINASPLERREARDRVKRG